MSILDHETFSSAHRECPYCGEKRYVEAEEYDEKHRVEECEQCGKKYHAWEEFTVDHHAHRDCTLNGETHERDPKYLDLCHKCSQYIHEKGEPE